MTLTRILFPTDFSACADGALAYATDLADRFGATLHLLHVVDELDPDWFGATDAGTRAVDLRDDIEAKAKRRLHEVATGDLADEVDTTVALRSSVEVEQTILDYAREENIDLIAMGTHGRRGFDRLMLGSVTNTVLRQAPCPVLTVREGHEQGKEEGPMFQNLLAPIDFSEASHEALRVSDGLAGAYAARLRLLFVAEERTVPTFSDTGLPGLGVMKMDSEIVDNAGAALQQLYERLGGDAAECSYHVQEGPAAETIAAFAGSEEVDLIVMATRGREGLDRFLVGTTTERVVRVAPCPVLTMRASGEGNEDV